MKNVLRKIWDQYEYSGNVLLEGLHIDGRPTLKGMTQSYISALYPAAMSYEVVMALVEASEELKAPYHVGIIRSADCDIVGGERPSVGAICNLFMLRSLIITHGQGA